MTHENRNLINYVFFVFFFSEKDPISDMDDPEVIVQACLLIYFYHFCLVIQG